MGDEPKYIYEPQPTEAQKALYDKFVDEYIKDFNGLQAAIRTGFNLTYAREYAPIFLGYPYVQRRIDELKSKPKEANVNHVDEVRQLVESTYRMVIASGDPKAAVTAATKLAEMNGLMVPPDKSGEELDKLVNAFKEVAKAVPD